MLVLQSLFFLFEACLIYISSCLVLEIHGDQNNNSRIYLSLVSMHDRNEQGNVKALCKAYNSIKIRHQLIPFPTASVCTITNGTLKIMKMPEHK